MSNDLAIAAVTRTLRNLLDHIPSADFSALPDDTRPTTEITVTTLPLDQVRSGNNTGNQINLYLYHTVPNSGWRNLTFPGRVKPGEAGFPPLALNLNYLITTYGQDNNEMIGHVLLGVAMRILHDHAVLSRTEIENALAVSEVHNQIERIRITPQPISLEEATKLWTGFQSQFRLSAAYEISVLLIESRRQVRAPLPVLVRGDGDRGVFTMASPPATVLQVRWPLSRPYPRLGDILTIHGQNLLAEGLRIRLTSQHLSAPLELTPLPGGGSTEIEARLPGVSDDPLVPASWVAGVVELSLTGQRPGLPPWSSNVIPLAIAPQLTGIAPAFVSAASPPAAVSVSCIPQIKANQRISLLLGERQFSASSVNTPADPTAPSTITFVITGLPPGQYLVRLRVDGVDSIPVIFSDTSPPAFDASQILTIT